MKDSNSPIGIFDSGIGGLTVAYAVTQLLPNENIIYFGDTAHFPYGDKSTAAIQSYAVKISEMLLKQHCKVILIACNSASAAAYKLVKEYVGSRAKVINVIDPIVQYVGAEYPKGKVGLIGTKKTVSSNVYQRKIDKLNKGIIFKAFATPLLAPMIEEGYFNNAISNNIISNYLEDSSLEGIESLILGCTHYPLIKEEIKNHYKGEVNVIDSSDIVANAVKEYLTSTHLLNENATPKHKFYVSDYTQSFAESTRLFFRQEVHLEMYPLWE